MKHVPISEKYFLTLEEAAAYFGIGINKMRGILSESREDLSLMNGSKKLIKRHKMEKYLDNRLVI